MFNYLLVELATIQFFEDCIGASVALVLVLPVCIAGW